MADPVQYADGDVSLSAIQTAQGRLSGHARLTPVLTCSTMDTLAGAELFFKCEIFQKTGSFKFRGALNAVSCALEANPDTAAVVCHSSGNHAAAVALAAKLKGLEAHIVVPSNTPLIKRNAVATYGGKLILCEPTVDAREAACAKVQAATGAAFIPPYNHPNVICGQGTIGIEFLDQVPDLDAIVVPISGGGMTSGIAVAAKSLKPGIKIIAAEPCGRDGKGADVAAAKEQGGIVEGMGKPDTICDGLQARLGSLTWPIVRDLVDAVEVVTEQQVVDAMRLVYERLKVVVEPSGAAGLAAALALKQRPENEALRKIGVILCGGNVDLEGQMPGFWGKWTQPPGAS